MATISEIKASAKLGHLSDVQRDAIQRITDHKTAWDFYRSYSAQRGVQYFPSDVFPELNLYSVSNGDYGPVIPVPSNFEQDQWYNWRPPVIFTYGTIAKLKPDAPAPYIDPGRPLANQIISAGDTILPSGNVSQIPVTAVPLIPTAPTAPAVEVIAKQQPLDIPAVQPTDLMPASQYPVDVYLRQNTIDSAPVSVSPGTVSSNVQMSFIGDLGKTLLGAATGFVTGGPIGAVAGGLAGSGVLGGNGQTPGIGPTSAPPTTIGGIDRGLAEVLAGAIGGVPGMVAQGAINYFSPEPAQTSMPSGLKSYDSRFGPEIVEALGKTIHKAPPGYVLVTKDWNGNGPSTYAVRKDVARLYGYRKPKKPPISVGEMSALKKSARVVAKMKRVDKMVDTLLKCKPTTRRR